MMYLTRRDAAKALYEEGMRWIRMGVGNTQKSADMTPMTISIEEYLAGEYERGGKLYLLFDPEDREVEARRCCGVVLLVVENKTDSETVAAVF